jgi:predicted dehydrogenase
VEAVLIGAGQRGLRVYGRIALEHPGNVRFVAVAEPDPERRDRFATQHGIPANRCFARWEDLIGAGRLASALLCCTLDRLHVEPTLAALQAGYHVLLEKPIAPTPEDCVRMVQAAERANRLLAIAHVLRYTSFFSALHRVVRDGRLGTIVSLQHSENVAYWHMAHSYVRGNWARSETTGPMILTKCCHDLDILAWIMSGDPVEQLYSFGSLLHFRPENAPPNAPERCLDGCPAAEECPYYAPRIYLTDNLGWPTQTISNDLSYDARLRALRTGTYGRCVYRAGNDVVDHQVTTMRHASGAISTLTMHGHSHEEARTTRIDGTRATLRARFTPSRGSEMVVYPHDSGVEPESVRVDGSERDGHGGGDLGVLRAFAESVGAADHGALTSARVSLESHLLAFAAEESRKSGVPIEMAKYRRSVDARAP